MKKQDIIDTILSMFNSLSGKAQVEVMTELYYEMNGYNKDEFLRKTENA